MDYEEENEDMQRAEAERDFRRTVAHYSDHAVLTLYAALRARRVDGRDYLNDAPRYFLKLVGQTLAPIGACGCILGTLALAQLDEEGVLIAVVNDGYVPDVFFATKNGERADTFTLLDQTIRQRSDAGMHPDAQSPLEEWAFGIEQGQESAYRDDFEQWTRDEMDRRVLSWDEADEVERLYAEAPRPDYNS